MSITEDKPQDYESLLAQITHPKKRAFLENYPKFCVTVETAKAIGEGEWSIYHWKREDEVFNQAFTALKKVIDHTRLQKYEAELDKRVLGTPSKQSDILLMFGLKAFNPDKYREKPPMMAQIAGNVVIKMDIPPYRDEIESKEKPLALQEGKANERSVTTGTDKITSEALQGEEGVTDH